MSINFSRAFQRGSRSYNSKVGEWWIRRSRDSSHQRAYRRIVEHIHGTLRSYRLRSPQFVVDYACGNGEMSRHLAREFPDARILALDGAKNMLRIALDNLKQHGLDAGLIDVEDAFRKPGPRIRLAQSALPNFLLPSHKADVALFLFPNMNFSAAEKRYLESYFQKHNGHVPSIARMLSRMGEDEEEQSRRAQNSIFQDLLCERALTENVHQLLKRGGTWFIVEYSNVPRQQLSEIEQWRMLFAEAAWHPIVNDRQLHDRFEYLGSQYYRSQVILDVYEQTHDPDDRTGGYFISAFRALEHNRAAGIG
jgi:SAM-dependent methyltransferase